MTTEQTTGLMTKVLTQCRRAWMLTVAACGAAMCSCSTAGSSYMAETGSGVWDSPVTLEIPNTDTLGLYDLHIALRHDGSPEASTIEMRVRTSTPDSLWVDEAFSLAVGDDGRSRSSQHETVGLYRRRVRLAREGRYRITITPARAVKGVYAVGIDLAPCSGEGKPKHDDNQI